jgi:hypothetical protein
MERHSSKASEEPPKHLKPPQQNYENEAKIIG